MKTKKKVAKKLIFNKNKKRKISWITIIPIALIIISFGIIGIFAYQNYLSKNQNKAKINETWILPEEKNNSNIPTISPNISPTIIPKSPESVDYFTEQLGYSFKWNKENKQAKILKDNQEILRFNLEEKPINIYFNPFSKKIALVTVKKAINEPHNLKIFSNGELKTIYTGKESENSIYYGNISLYNYYNSEEWYQDFYKDQIKFSRNGDFIMFHFHGFESATNVMININNLEKSYFNDNYHTMSGLIYWSPDSLSYIFIGQNYGEDSCSFLGGLTNESSKRFELRKNEMNCDDYKIYWKDNYNGLIYFNDKLSFIFNLDNKTLTENTQPIDFSIYKIDDGSYSLNLFHSLED